MDTLADPSPEKSTWSTPYGHKGTSGFAVVSGLNNELNL
jgi:hypothetical protein